MNAFAFLILDEFQRRADEVQKTRTHAREFQMKQAKQARTAQRRRQVAAFAASLLNLIIKG